MGITQAQGQKIKTIVKEQEQPLFNVSKRIINWLKKSEVHLGGILSFWATKLDQSKHFTFRNTCSLS